MGQEEALFTRAGQRKYLNWPEREAFFRAVKTCPDAAQRAFCLTLFYTGCRLSEAIELTGERVDFSEQTVILRTLKRRDPGAFRVIPIPTSLVRLLGEVVILKKNSTDPLWPISRTTGYRLIKATMAQAGITGVKACPKGLRHSYAVACVSRGVPVTTVQRWMGHARLDTTAIYLTMIGEEDRKQAAKIWRTS